MTRAEAITNLNMISVAFVEPVTKEQKKLIDDTFDMAIKALSQEPCEWGRMTFDAATGISKFEFSDGTIKRVKQAVLEPCEDCVSREAVIDTLQYAWEARKDIQESIVEIEALPSVTQKSKTGDDWRKGFLAGMDHCIGIIKGESRQKGGKE